MSQALDCYWATLHVVLSTRQFFHHSHRAHLPPAFHHLLHSLQCLLPLAGCKHTAWRVSRGCLHPAETKESSFLQGANTPHDSTRERATQLAEFALLRAYKDEKPTAPHADATRAQPNALSRNRPPRRLRNPNLPTPQSSTKPPTASAPSTYKASTPKENVTKSIAT